MNTRFLRCKAFAVLIGWIGNPNYKAMSALTEGTGLVLVLVSLQ